MICKNYKTIIIIIKFNNLLSLINNFNINKSIVPFNLIPENFILQYEDIINQLILNFKLDINRSIYYLDNLNLFTKYHYNELEYSKKEKNKDWAEIFKIKRIKTSDLLVINKKKKQQYKDKTSYTNKLKKSILKWIT